VGRGEMLIEPGDSWFSPKCIEVQPQMIANGGRALDGLDEIVSRQIQPNHECH